jgi:hypothetical protein
MRNQIAEQVHSVATDKSKLMVYLDPTYKKGLEQLSEVHSRSMSNFVEVLIKEAVDKALRDGVIRGEEKK